jgi:hypothetical protein
VADKDCKETQIMWEGVKVEEIIMRLLTSEIIIIVHLTIIAPIIAT